MNFLRKLLKKIRASIYVFKKADIMKNVVNKEIGGEYDNLCSQCYFNERFQQETVAKGTFEPAKHARIAIYLGGALGDYIVYLRFVDEISSICECEVDLFLDRIEFARFVYGKREKVTIVHDVDNTLFINSCKYYDLSLHLDHGLLLKHANLGNIRVKAPELYITACKIAEHAKRQSLSVSQQHERECVILRRARLLGETKWSKLSCDGAVDTNKMYSNILLDTSFLPVLARYHVRDKKYITVNYGADKNMGGTAQTKVLSAQTLMAVIEKFKKLYPDYLVVQTGLHNSMPLQGADQYAFDCTLEETAIILKYATCHVDSEGGLVHMASQLSTRCVVCFGPTPSYYYGYGRNENIVSPACSDCMSITNKWSVVCPRGMQVPECMQAITPDMILSGVTKIILAAQNEKTVKMDQIAAPMRKDMFTEQMQEIVDKSQLADESLRVCFITELNSFSYELALFFKKYGHEVSIFIGTHLSDDVVKLRTKLKSQGICVEYGNALNIGRPNKYFDIVIHFHPDEPVQDSWIVNAQLEECNRITKQDGKVITVSSGLR